MKTFHDTAPQPQKQDPVNFAAGYHLTPGRLAMQNVKAYLSLCLAIAAAVGGIAAALDQRQIWPLAVGLVSAIAAVIYASSLRSGVVNVQRQLWTDAQRQWYTWQRELATGDDIDGDGHIGQPPSVVVGRILPVGKGDNSVTLPDLNPVPQAIALNGFPTDPPIAPNDVVYILTHAAAGDGLSFRSWDKRRLPSGAEIKRDLWAGILDGLLQWHMATASETTDGRRVVTLRSDVDIEVMIQYIRSAVEPVENNRVVS